MPPNSRYAPFRNIGPQFSPPPRRQAGGRRTDVTRKLRHFPDSPFRFSRQARTPDRNLRVSISILSVACKVEMWGRLANHRKALRLRVCARVCFRMFPSAGFASATSPAPRGPCMDPADIDCPLASDDEWICLVRGRLICLVRRRPRVVAPAADRFDLSGDGSFY